MAVLKVKDGSSSWHNIDSIKGDKGDTGTSIVSVTKTGSQGLVDTYTILFSDNTTTTFQVKNGENGQGSGSVTSVDTGVGLTGGAITSSGTIKADLVSDTYSTQASETITQTSGRQYAVNPDANGKLSVNVPWTDEGKTYTAGTNVQISSSNVISATDTTYESKPAASGGTAVSLVTTGEKYTWNQAEPNVQSDWNATSGDAKILNKPTNVSAFTNDAGYLTSFTETDPTVPSWAKQSSKPTYTASEVGALPDTTSIPSKTSDLTNDSNFVADASYVHTDNNYTSTEKSKLSGIAAGAEVNVQSDWNQTTTTADDYIKNKPTIPTVPTNVSAFTNDAGYITGYTETDPVFSASAASGITSADIIKLGGFNIATPKADAEQYATFAELPLKTGTYVVLHADGTTADSGSPMPTYTGDCWWNVINTGTYPVGSYAHESEWYQRILQIASNAFGSDKNVYYRIRRDDEWSSWFKVQTPANGSLSFINTSYTTILALLNDYPQSGGVTNFTKAGFASFTDLPSGIASTTEWIARTIGDDTRRTVILYQYGVPQLAYKRDIYQGSWTGDWIPLGSRVVTVDVPSFSSLPQTVSNGWVSSEHVCIKAELGTPSAQNGDWTVTTSAGSLTISGSISGSTTAKLYLTLRQ